VSRNTVAGATASKRLFSRIGAKCERLPGLAWHRAARADTYTTR
jgi:hypothetical protein